MEKLQLWWNAFGNFGATCLALCIHNIEELSICNCGVDSRGIDILVSSIANLLKPVNIQFMNCRHFT